MAYTKDELEKMCLDAIKKEKICFFTYLDAYIQPCIATLYNSKIEELETIKKAIALNAIGAKDRMISNWIESDNATLQIAAMKMLSDDREHAKISGQHIDHTTKNEKIESIKITFSDDIDAPKPTDN